MPTIDENARRRGDFAGGAPVVLADGQVWYLAKPRVRLTPDDADGFRVILTLAADDGYQQLYDRWESARKRIKEHRDLTQVAEEALAAGDEAAAFPEPIHRRDTPAAMEIQMGRALLLRNYDLTRDEVDQVLQFGYDDDDPEGKRIMEEVVSLAIGSGPKPPPATSDSAS